MMFNCKDSQVFQSFWSHIAAGTLFGIASFVLSPLTQIVIVFGMVFMEVFDGAFFGGNDFSCDLIVPDLLHVCIGQLIFFILLHIYLFMDWHRQYLIKLEHDKEWRAKKQAATDAKMLAAADPASSKLRHYIVYPDSEGDTVQAVLEAAAESREDVADLARKNGISIQGMKISKTNIFLSDTHGFRVTEKFIRQTNAAYNTSQLRDT